MDKYDTFSRLWTGHLPVRKHLNKIGMYNGDLRYRQCNKDTETVLHILCQCEAFDHRRQNIYGKPNMDPQDYYEQPGQNLYRLVHGTRSSSPAPLSSYFSKAKWLKSILDILNVSLGLFQYLALPIILLPTTSEEPHGSCTRKGWLLLLFAMVPWERLKFILVFLVSHLLYSPEKTQKTRDITNSRAGELMKQSAEVSDGPVSTPPRKSFKQGFKYLTLKLTPSRYRFLNRAGFMRHVGFKTPLFPSHFIRLWPGSNYLEDLLGDVPLATVRPFEGCGCNMMVLHLTMPFRSVGFIFIVSPFHRKIAGRGIDLLLTPFIEKTKSVGFIFIISPFHRKISGRGIDLLLTPFIEKTENTRPQKIAAPNAPIQDTIFNF
ncbi:hypothetical protein NQ317_014147 [Molorchus minor]|uniref:Reverse transcriptase zinc-binding domain-containing protein n=1 Tax=Molorchus minor TaxID=1323400 RepID=A0ABQ9J484_9CUCU|nr:hypothetical protein NQ317_014147 [Molorchus minor]